MRGDDGNEFPASVVRTLDASTLAALPAPVGRPGYDRERLGTGIVHFGPGGFHRAHQADYVDRLLGHDPRWGIAAVSLRSAGTVEALARQDGLYTLAILDAEPSLRVIGSHTRFVGPSDAGGLRALLADPAVRLVTATVTEKGYALAADGTLDLDHPDIVHDLAHPDSPRSLAGWLTLGLRARRDAALPAFVTLSCDNMVANGAKLGAAVRALAARRDPELARWIEGEARFPNGMVDSITPAADDRLRERVRRETGLDDEIPISREAYADWVIEGPLPADGPDLASAGAVIADDVRGYELAKLRILNGAHSSLAYMGLLRGHATVDDATGDGALAGFVARLIRDDIVPTIRARAPFDLDAHAERILERFRNPAIGHRLAQIAWDGSQKLPYRLLDTIADARAAGRSVERLAVPVAAWMAFVRRQARAGVAIVDPLAGRLAAIGREAGGDETLIDSLIGLREIFPAALAGDTDFRSALVRALESLTGAVHA